MFFLGPQVRWASSRRQLTASGDVWCWCMLCAYVSDLVVCVPECVWANGPSGLVCGKWGPHGRTSIFSDGTGPWVSEKCSNEFSVMNRHPYALKAAWVTAITTQHSSQRLAS